MSYIKVGEENGSAIQNYYKSGGPLKGKKELTVVFCHGWPLNADAFDDQMFYLAEKGYCCYAHDRRGHGRSSQPWHGHDMDTYAEDLHKLIECLDLKNIVLVGHSTGGGEAARYIGRYGTKRVKGFVPISAVPPQMLKTPENPEGTDIETFNKIREGLVENRSEYLKELAVPFFGFNRSTANKSEGLIQSFWLSGMLAALRALYKCVKAFSETNFNEDLKKVNVPTLIIHGDDDQIVPIQDASIKTEQVLKREAKNSDVHLEIIPQAPHGLCSTHKKIINEKLYAFLERI